MPKDTTIEQFRDLHLVGDAANLDKLRKALIAHATSPWCHAVEREREAASIAGDGDVILFEHDGADGLSAAGLTLWSRPGSYEVTNIIPLEADRLTHTEYNALLQDFLTRIAGPAAAECGFRVTTTAAQQSLDDWLPKHLADDLRRFSLAANKSTGSAHPYDRQRWFTFLIDMHKANTKLGTDRLMRWLIEVEGWPEDKAIELVVEYEFAFALLEQYDEYLGR